MYQLRSHKGRINAVMLWLLVAIVTIVFTALAFFPASLLAALVEKQTDGRISLGDVEGTLWNGSAFLGVASGRNAPVSPLLPGRFTWRLSPAVLLGRVDVSLDNSTALSNPVRIAGTWNEWSVGPTAIMLPAERLAGLGAPLNTIQPSGQMRLTWGTLQMKREGGGLNVNGTMSLEMNDMSSRLSPIRPLGAYILISEWNGNRAQLTLKTIRGPMLLSGTGQLVGGRLQFSGKAEAETGQEEKLGNLLNLLGQRRREGNKNVIALEFK